MFWFSFLTIIFIFSWFFLFFLLFSYNYVRLFSLFFFSLFVLFSLSFLLFLNKSIFWYQAIFKFYHLFFFKISYVLAIDSISIFLILLSAFILLYCFLSYWFLRYKIALYSFLLFISLWLLFNVFSVADLFFFYIFFEGIVIPMFFIIGIWGSRSRKIYASYQFFVYTLLGSIFVLLCFFNIFFYNGSSSFDYYLNSFIFDSRQFIFWLFMFFGFAVKIPMLPVHIWLPEAHVEAPTPGSVILAGILLKLGSYAMLKLILVPFTSIYTDLVFLIFILALVGFIYSSMVAFSQVDIKKTIAYSSIAHMNFSIIGLFSQHILGIFGVFIMMLGHAITSGALFLGIGVLYDRYKTRIIFYYGSLATVMPIFSILYFFFIFSNFGFPGTVNFVGELFILVGGFYFSNAVIFLSSFAMILSLVYSLFFYSRIFFGPVPKMFIRYFCDLLRLEFFVLFIFVLLVVLLGLYPKLILDFSIFSLLKFTAFNL